MNQSDAISKRGVVIKNIKTTQSKLDNARWEMTGERTVSYSTDPIHWGTRSDEDIMRDSDDEESESE